MNRQDLLNFKEVLMVYIWNFPNGITDERYEKLYKKIRDVVRQIDKMLTAEDIT